MYKVPSADGMAAYLGYIYGTGTNVCYIEDVKNITKINDVKCGRMLINTECGNFDLSLHDDIARAEFTIAPIFAARSISSSATPHANWFFK